VQSCAGDAANDGPVDTSTMGMFTFVVDASDTTGHATSSSSTYTVGYRFTGFFGIAPEPALNTANAGRSIPVSWTMQDGSGAYIGDPADPWAHVDSITWYQVQCPGSPPSTNPTPSNDSGSSGLRFDDPTKTFEFNWKSETAWAGTCRRFVVTTDDTATHTFTIRFT
jgi:hypothetical protein